MASIINASTSAGLIQTADTSGTLQLQGGGATGLTVDTSGAYGVLKSATIQNSTSGTSIDFTGIPSWAKRITVMFSGMSTSSTSALQVQIGSGSVTTTGYVAWGTNVAAATLTGSTYTTGFPLNNGSVATNLYGGQAILSALGSNTWTYSSSLGATGSGSFGAGNLTLSGALDRVRITTFNGTDTFDAGSINIMYEG